VAGLFVSPCSLVGVFLERVDKVIARIPETLADYLRNDVADAREISTLMRCGEENKETSRREDGCVFCVQLGFDKRLYYRAEVRGMAPRAMNEQSKLTDLTTMPPRLWQMKTSGLWGSLYVARSVRISRSKR